MPAFRSAFSSLPLSLSLSLLSFIRKIVIEEKEIKKLRIGPLIIHGIESVLRNCLSFNQSKIILNFTDDLYIHSPYAFMA
jgi:hypothetical protein